MPRPIEAVIHASHLSHNLGVARERAGGARVWAVVKANAYGHGIERCFDALRQVADGFACIDLAEAGTCADGKVYGLSLRGEWLPIGPEGQSWEWANYGGLKKPKGPYISLDTLGRSAYREKAVKQNGPAKDQAKALRDAAKRLLGAPAAA